VLDQVESGTCVPSWSVSPDDETLTRTGEAHGG
jgi:hypothetical protein